MVSSVAEQVFRSLIKVAIPQCRNAPFIEKSSEFKMLLGLRGRRLKLNVLILLLLLLAVSKCHQVLSAKWT